MIKKMPRAFLETEKNVSRRDKEKGGSRGAALKTSDEEKDDSSIAKAPMEEKEGIRKERCHGKTSKKNDTPFTYSRRLRMGPAGGPADQHASRVRGCNEVIERLLTYYWPGKGILHYLTGPSARLADHSQ